MSDITFCTQTYPQLRKNLSQTPISKMSTVKEFLIWGFVILSEPINLMSSLTSDIQKRLLTNKIIKDVWFVNTTYTFNISIRSIYISVWDMSTKPCGNIHRRSMTQIFTFISWVNFMICSSSARFAWSCPFTLCSRVSIRRTSDKKELSSLQLHIDPNSNFIFTQRY